MMIKAVLLVSLSGFSPTLYGQVLCIYCFEQNAPINTGLPNLITNGSFEAHDCIPNNWHQSGFCPNSSFYNCDIDDWICSGGGTDTYALIGNHLATVIPQGSFAAYFGNSFCTPCSNVPNDISCLADLGCTITGVPDGFPTHLPEFGGTAGVRLEQTVSGLTVGNLYMLEFWAGGEFNQSYAGVFAVDVGFGDTLMPNNPTTIDIGVGTRYLVIFNATSTDHTIRFTNWGHIALDHTELMLDDVALYHLEATASPCTLGIVGIERTPARLLPMPATDSFIIEGIQYGTALHLFDATGREVPVPIERAADRATVRVEHLPRGLYVLKFDEDAAKQARTVVLQ